MQRGAAANPTWQAGPKLIVVELETGYNGRVVRETDYEILDEC